MLDTIKLIRKNIKCANLKVKPTLEVVLTIPSDMSEEEINKILLKRQDWILKQLEYFRKFQITPKKLVSGENFEYLGRSYRLKVIESTDELVKLSGGYLVIFIHDKSNLTRKQELIHNWYFEKASTYFIKIINKYQPIVNKDVTKISIRKMKTRWGSCNPVKSYINLNLELITKPKHAIEYVIFHELAHLIHYNHDRNFYNYLSTHMPDWKFRRDKLNQI